MLIKRGSCLEFLCAAHKKQHKKPVSVPVWTTQISHGLSWHKTRACMVRIKYVTASAIPWPPCAVDPGYNATMNTIISVHHLQSF